MSISIGGMSLGMQQSGYSGTLYRSVDRNRDSAYSRQEVDNFAKSYEKSTGKALDVDEVFKAYDLDLDGSLSSSEYRQVMEDDALRMDRLYGAEQETGKTSSIESETDMTSWLQRLTSSQKMSLARSSFRAESTGNLLNAMFGSSGLLSGKRTSSIVNIGDVLARYNNAKLNSYVNEVSSLDLRI